MNVCKQYFKESFTLCSVCGYNNLLSENKRIVQFWEIYQNARIIFHKRMLSKVHSKLGIGY